MSPSPHASDPATGCPPTAVDGWPAATIASTIGAWRESGRDRFDPVGFCYLEALAGRGSTLSGAVRQAVDHKLAAAIAAYAGRLDQAGVELTGIAERLKSRFPDAGSDIDQRLAAFDLRGMRRLAARLETHRDGGRPLADLVRRIDRQPAAADQALAATAAPRELKTLRDGRHAWTRLSIDRQLTRSLAKAPDNPGPLNSHRLVLRALQTMQAVSPAYLQQFIGYAETLLWLDQASFGAATETGKAVRRDNDRKRRR